MQANVHASIASANVLKPHSRAATVLWDELYAGRLKRAANRVSVRSHHAGKSTTTFSTSDGDQADAGRFRQLLTRHADKGASSPHLTGSDRAFFSIIRH